MSIAKAGESITSGAARAKLDALVRETHLAADLEVNLKANLEANLKVNFKAKAAAE